MIEIEKTSLPYTSGSGIYDWGIEKVIFKAKTGDIIRAEFSWRSGDIDGEIDVLRNRST